MRQILACLAVWWSLAAAIEAEEWPMVYDCAAQKWCSMGILEEALGRNEIVFVGEFHDHVWGHTVEATLLAAFYQKHANVAVALEMFERDAQFVMNGYLAAEVSEGFFLRHSRPWKNYQGAYRPLVEFARARNLPVLAMNVPRRYAACAANGQEQFFTQLPELEKSYLAGEIIALPGKYRDKFYETMKGHAPPAVIERYYRAQCLKDDTMAMSIVEYLTLAPHSRVISYTGAFHSDERMGLVEKVARQLPGTHTLVLTILPAEAGKIPEPEKYAHLADFLLFAPANEGQVAEHDLPGEFAELVVDAHPK